MGIFKRTLDILPKYFRIKLACQRHTGGVKNTTGQLHFLFMTPLKCHVQKNIHIRYQYPLLILHSNHEWTVWHWQILPASWRCCFMTSLYTFTTFHSINCVLSFLCWIKEKKKQLVLQRKPIAHLHFTSLKNSFQSHISALCLHFCLY